LQGPLFHPSLASDAYRVFLLGVDVNCGCLRSLEVYPEHKWIPWLFKYVGNGFWADKSHHAQYFDWAAKQLGFESSALERWYDVKPSQISKLKGMLTILWLPFGVSDAV
jgi:hypothetical protein